MIEIRKDCFGFRANLYLSLNVKLALLGKNNFERFSCVNC